MFKNPASEECSECHVDVTEMNFEVHVGDRCEVRVLAGSKFPEYSYSDSGRGKGMHSAECVVYELNISPTGTD